MLMIRKPCSTKWEPSAHCSSGKRLAMERAGKKAVVIMVALLGASAAWADNHKQVKLNVAANGVVNVVNPFGSVTVKPGAARQVLVTYPPTSNKIQLTPNATPNPPRI